MLELLPLTITVFAVAVMSCLVILFMARGFRRLRQTDLRIISELTAMTANSAVERANQRSATATLTAALDRAAGSGDDLRAAVADVLAIVKQPARKPAPRKAAG